MGVAGGVVRLPSSAELLAPSLEGQEKPQLPVLRPDNTKAWTTRAFLCTGSVLALFLQAGSTLLVRDGLLKSLWCWAVPLVSQSPASPTPKVSEWSVSPSTVSLFSPRMGVGALQKGWQHGGGDSDGESTVRVRKGPATEDAIVVLKKQESWQAQNSEFLLEKTVQVWLCRIQDRVHQGSH